MYLRFFSFFFIKSAQCVFFNGHGGVGGGALVTRLPPTSEIRG